MSSFWTLRRCLISFSFLTAYCLWDRRCYLQRGSYWFQGHPSVQGVHANARVSRRKRRVKSRCLWIQPDRGGSQFGIVLHKEELRNDLYAWYNICIILVQGYNWKKVFSSHQRALFHIVIFYVLIQMVFDWGPRPISWMTIYLRARLDSNSDIFFFWVYILVIVLTLTKSQNLNFFFFCCSKMFDALIQRVFDWGPRPISWMNGERPMMKISHSYW